MRKPLLLSIATTVLCIFSNHQVEAQTVSDLESFAATDTFYNGSDNPLGYTFSDGNITLHNYYDTAYGGYWSGGFAISGMKDSVTPGAANLYSAVTATGYNNSSTYAVGTNGAKAILTGNGSGKLMEGLYITNSTYAAISMRDGDSFAKKFGGPSGNDPDWFKLDIIGYSAGSITDTVDFYLADFRFSDNSMDYVVKDWRWVDLKPLGNVDSISFSLSSSDVGGFGMNTPAFFAIDDATTLNSGLNLIQHDIESFDLYPNPANAYVNLVGLDGLFNIEIFSQSGVKVFETKTNQSRLDLSGLSPALYILKVSSGNKVYSKQLVIK
jgi:hypothetical protein